MSGDMFELEEHMYSCLQRDEVPRKSKPYVVAGNVLNFFRNPADMLIYLFRGWNCFLSETAF